MSDHLDPDGQDPFSKSPLVGVIWALGANLLAVIVIGLIIWAVFAS